jgi:hypothetical protein
MREKGFPVLCVTGPGSAGTEVDVVYENGQKVKYAGNDLTLECAKSLRDKML